METAFTESTTQIIAITRHLTLIFYSSYLSSLQLYSTVRAVNVPPGEALVSASCLIILLAAYSQ